MIRRIVVSLVVGLLLASIKPSAQVRSLVAPGSTVERIATGFGFLEGPAADPDGNLYFSDIPRDRIHCWTPETGVSTFREAAGRANGLRFTPDGQLVICEMGNRRVTAIDAGGQVSVLADALEGRRFNSPNDLWVDPKGGIYFSDPRYGADDDKEMDGDHVYYISLDRTEVRRVASDLVRPNGIVGTTDGDRIYVADHGAGRSLYETTGRWVTSGYSPPRVQTE